MSLKDLFESPVGSIGRTGLADAKAHVTPELRNEFKKLVKKMGGKTVAKQLLAEMNSDGIVESVTNVNIGVEASTPNYKKIISSIESILDKLEVNYNNEGSDKNVYNINSGFSDRKEAEKFDKQISKFEVTSELETLD